MGGDRRSRSVLVLEDDAVLVRLFETILKKAGFEISTASTVPAVQGLVEDRSFDVFVCDLSIAGGSNIFSLVKCIRAHHPEIAILVVSGYAPHEIASEVANHDIELLEKPFSPPELVKRVVSLMARTAA